MKIIDCRGLPCPQPVINTKNALDECSPGEKIVVLVDNDAAVKNVSRFAEAQGHTVNVIEKEDFWEIEITKGEESGQEVAISCATGDASICVVLDGKTMGRGEEALGHVLMRAFLKTLKEASVKPKTIICYNAGIFLALEDSEVLNDLKALEEIGIEILVCGTCLDFYGVKDRLAVGKVSNMFDIVEKLMASRVVKP